MQLRKFLYPFSWLYGGVTSVRNKLFDWEVLPSQKYDFPVISVGNITVGGTGKTPLTEYLIRLLKDDWNLALLSRGYKRQTKGALLAEKDATANEIGDEPYQMLSKFPQLNVVVAEKRVEGMDIIQKSTSTNVVLMDDAYQHRYVCPGLSILVIDYNRPLWKDAPFPAGDLRETKAGQNRADLIVINKCPQQLTVEEKNKWIKKLKPEPHQKVFFSSVNYGMPIDLKRNVLNLNDRPLMLLAGIARPEPFYEFVEQQYQVHNKLTYPDHHHFDEKDIAKIKQRLGALGDKAKIVTTEKDFGRLKGWDSEIENALVYIPIELKILFDEENLFELIIRNYVREYQKDS